MDEKLVVPVPDEVALPAESLDEGRRELAPSNKGRKDPGGAGLGDWTEGCL
jgi:hypothetical protein